MTEKSLKAKIFISCGQREREEREIAERISKILIERGFETYIAIFDKTTLGLIENIFNHLETSEYFLFIDYKREKVCNPKSIYRGSLFTNQELAIASYLEIPSIGFIEKGIKHLDGILNYIQLNCETFEKREDLIELVPKVIEKENWDPCWKNQLELIRVSKEFDDTKMVINKFHKKKIKQEIYRKRVFHIGVRNNNKNKAALNCNVVLKRAEDLEDNETIHIDEMVDFKWAGFDLPTATISPGLIRQFDAFYVEPQEPQIIKFNLVSRYGNFIDRFTERFKGRKKVKFIFVVRSDNFLPAEESFYLELDEKLANIRFVQEGFLYSRE